VCACVCVCCVCTCVCVVCVCVYSTVLMRYVALQFHNYVSVFQLANCEMTMGVTLNTKGSLGHKNWMRRNYTVQLITTPTTISQHHARAIHASVPCLHTFQCSVTAETGLLHLQPFMNNHFNFLISVECVALGQLLQLIVVLCSKITTFHLNKWVAFVLILKPTRYTNFSNLFLQWNSTYVRKFLCPSPAVPSWSCLQAVSKPVWHIPLLCVQWKTPNDVQRNCLKHVVLFQK